MGKKKGKRFKENEKPTKRTKTSNTRASKNKASNTRTSRTSSSAGVTKAKVGSSSKKRNKKKTSVIPKILSVIFIALLISGCVFAYRAYKNGGGLSGILATFLGHNEETRKNLPELKVLLMGVSTDIDAELTDTIMVASYNPNTQKATLLSIPRDTFVGYSKTKASGGDKINALYNMYGGPEETLEKVNDITGLDIKYYATVKTGALVDLVNAIGSVKFNVPIDMEYDDDSQDLHIKLDAGEQEIDGQKAEWLLRFRHNNDGSSYPTEYGDNDIGRMRTQREFIAETLRQTLKVENIFKLGQILDVAKNSVDTNMDFGAVKDYIPYAVEFNTENMVSDTLPGKPDKYNDIWFYIYDEDETEKLVHKLFYERDYGEASPDASATATSSASTEKPKEKLLVQVVNATGEAESATYQKAVQALQDAGFKVSKPKKPGVESSRTIITNQKYASDSIIEEIRTLLGTGDVSNNASSTSESDISVTIGTDYQ